MFSDYIQVIQFIVASLWIALVLFMTAYSIKYFAQIMKTKKYSAKPLFKDFGQKMWMTAGIGIFFFGMYAGIVLLSSYLMDKQIRQKIFFLAYKHPTNFIYGGLIVFACLSICIYIARRVIIHLYNSRHK